MSAFFAFILTKVITFLSLIPLFTTVKFENQVVSVRWHNLDRLSPWYEADALDQWRTPYRTYFLLDLFFYYSYISNRTDWNYFPYGRGLQIKCGGGYPWGIVLIFNMIYFRTILVQVVHVRCLWCQSLNFNRQYRILWQKNII